MSDETPEETSTRAGILRLAAAMFVATWFWVFATARSYHLSPGHSASLGLQAAVAAFVAWFVYHLVSRRNDGMAAFSGGMVIPTLCLRDGRFPPFWFLVLGQLVSLLPIALYARFKARRAGLKKAMSRIDPLYDAEMDRPLRS